MKTMTWLGLGLSLLLAGSGCQHATAPSLAMQDKFFSSLKSPDPEADSAVRRAHYNQLVGRHDLALKELRLAVSSNPQNVRLLNAMGNCYDRLGDYARAQEAYEQILALDADNFPARNNLGYSHYLAGDLARAEQIFQEVITRNSQDVVARNNLGLLWCRQGKEQQALSLWQKNEGDYAAREKLQHVLAFLGRPVETNLAAASPAPGKAAQGAGVLKNPPQEQAASQAPPPEIARSEPKPVAARTAATGRAELEPAAGQTAKSSRTQGRTAPGIPVQVEEVEMVIQPASYSLPLTPNPVTGESIVTGPQRANLAQKPASQSATMARRTEISLPDGDDELEEDEPVARPRYRPRAWRRYWKPRIITCTPQEPPQPKQGLNNYLKNESIYQPQSASGKPQAVVF